MSNNNSFASPQQSWLDELESELVSVSPSTGSDTTSDLSKDNMDLDNQVKSRKIRNRMMKLYLTIASDDSNTSNKNSTSDTQPYYTIVDSNNNNLNNINSAFLKKLDEKEIAQLKKFMLTRQLSQTSASQTTKKNEKAANAVNNSMFVLCSPINNKTHKLIDSLINQLEKQHLGQDNQSISPSQLASDNVTEWNHPTMGASCDNFEFDQMNAKTAALKERIMNLKKKYQILKQKRAIEKSSKKKLFSKQLANSGKTKKTNKKYQNSQIKQTNLKHKRRSKTSNAQDFQTKLKRYGTHYNVNSKGFHHNHVEMIERRSASMIVNPKSLTKATKKTKTTQRKGSKSQKKRYRRNPAARIPWRG